MKTTRMLAAKRVRDSKTPAPTSHPAKLKKLGEQKDIGDYRRAAAKRASGAKSAEEKSVVAPAKSDANDMATKAEAEERKALDRQLARIARKRIVEQQSRTREESKRKIQREKLQETEQRVKVDLSTIGWPTGNEASAIDRSL